MGVYGDGGNAKKGKGRGKTDVARSLEGLGSDKGRSGGADWGDCSPELIIGVLLEITRRGGAASFGLSRDKGAFNLTLFLDGTRKTVWVSSGDDLEAELEKVIAYLGALPED